MKLNVYTDGSGTTRGPGGIGYVAYHEDGETHSEGSLPLDEATNQKAEILAAAYALHSLPEGSDVTIYSDSEYVVKGASQWLAGWIARDWRKTDGGRVSNRAHWQRLIDATSRHASVRYEWIEGHAGIAGNERADKLAGEARALAKQRVAERAPLENEARILAECEELVAAGLARWVATEEEYEAAGPIGRKPFDLDAHLRKQEAKQRLAGALDGATENEPVDEVEPAIEQAELFNVPALAKQDDREYGNAKAARDEAIARADEAADDGWKRAAYEAVECVAAQRAEFTADAVWYVLERRNVAAPREPRALAGVLRKAQAEGLIEPTGRYSPSVRRHASPVQVWASKRAPIDRAA